MPPQQYLFIFLAITSIAIILTPGRRRVLVASSFFVGVLGLSLVLWPQVTIDKVISQRSIETLNLLAADMTIVFLLAIVGELALDRYAKRIARRPDVSPLELKLSLELPRALAALLVLGVYNVKFAALALAIAVLESGALFFSIANRVTREAIETEDASPPIFWRTLPLSWSLLLSGSFLLLLWFGTYDVLDNRWSLGQLVSFLLVNSQFLLVVLSLVNAIALNRRTREDSRM